MALSTSLFDYHLPEELIAQYPADRRDGSRMMVLDPESGDTEIRPFSDIVNYLHSGDRMVCNNTKVLRGRMFGRDGAGAPCSAPANAPGRARWSRCWTATES